jgi:hypothetical protein
MLLTDRLGAQLHAQLPADHVAFSFSQWHVFCAIYRKFDHCMLSEDLLRVLHA